MVAGTLIVSILSLIVTIVGWSFTSRNQKELLDKQIAADKQQTKLQFAIPRRIDQFDKIKSWVTETRQIKREVINPYLSPDDKPKIIERFKEWEALFWTEINPTADIFDPALSVALRKAFVLQHMTFSFILTDHRDYIDTSAHKALLKEAENNLDSILTTTEKALTSLPNE